MSLLPFKHPRTDRRVCHFDTGSARYLDSQSQNGSVEKSLRKERSRRVITRRCRACVGRGCFTRWLPSWISRRDLSPVALAFGARRDSRGQAGVGTDQRPSNGGDPSVISTTVSRRCILCSVQESAARGEIPAQGKIAKGHHATLSCVRRASVFHSLVAILNSAQGSLTRGVGLRREPGSR